MVESEGCVVAWKIMVVVVVTVMMMVMVDCALHCRLVVGACAEVLCERFSDELVASCC